MCEKLIHPPPQKKGTNTKKKTAAWPGGFFFWFWEEGQVSPPNFFEANKTQWLNPYFDKNFLDHFLVGKVSTKSPHKIGGFHGDLTGTFPKVTTPSPEQKKSQVSLEFYLLT